MRGRDEDCNGRKKEDFHSAGVRLVRRVSLKRSDRILEKWVVRAAARRLGRAQHRRQEALHRRARVPPRAPHALLPAAVQPPPAELLDVDLAARVAVELAVRIRELLFGGMRPPQPLEQRRELVRVHRARVVRVDSPEDVPHLGLLARARGLAPAVRHRRLRRGLGRLVARGRDLGGRPGQVARPRAHAPERLRGRRTCVGV